MSRRVLMGFGAIFIALISVWSIVEGKVAQKGCDIFQGNWVVDSSYPLYESSACPFIEGQFDCRIHGRPDDDYTKYRWQPSGDCVLPRFNGVDFMRKVKGKRLMFVGDSLSLNQWQSLTCMLHVALPQTRYISNTRQGLSTFTFPDYNASIMFYRNAFLVDITNEIEGRVLRLDSLSSANIWAGMDILIFDSWHWWLHNDRKQPWDWVVYGNTRVKDMERLALNTWAQWIQLKLKFSSKLFLPIMTVGKDWMPQTQPLKRTGSPHPAEVVLEKWPNLSIY